MTDINSGKNKVIGLCGRSGSGKTTVCATAAELGIMSVDTDRVYRELTAPASDGTPSELVRLIRDRFGESVVCPDGTLDRRALAGIVFGEGNEGNLADLNRITHERILAETERRIEEYFSKGAAGVIVDAPALFESGFDKKCDVILCVSAPDDILVERIMNRDHISEEAALKRLSSQISAKELKEKADFVIENDGRADLSGVAKAVFEKIFDIQRGFEE